MVTWYAIGLFVDEPVIGQDCLRKHSAVGHSFTLSMLSCRADGNPHATLHWYHGGKLIDASTQLIRNQSGTFILEANNTMGQTNMSIDITIECMYDNIYHIPSPLNEVIRRIHISCKTAQTTNLNNEFSTMP